MSLLYQGSNPLENTAKFLSYGYMVWEIVFCNKTSPTIGSIFYSWGWGDSLVLFKVCPISMNYFTWKEWLALSHGSKVLKEHLNRSNVQSQIFIDWVDCKSPVLRESLATAPGMVQTPLELGYPGTQPGPNSAALVSAVTAGHTVRRCVAIPVVTLPFLLEEDGLGVPHLLQESLSFFLLLPQYL